MKPNSTENCQFSAFLRTLKSSKLNKMEHGLKSIKLHFILLWARYGKFNDYRREAPILELRRTKSIQAAIE